MNLTVTTTIFGLPGGPRVTHVQLTLPSPALSAGELIACKVLQEVEECRSRRRTALSGEYWTAEQLLAGASEHDVMGEPADELSRAQKAFADRAYMIVVDDKRIYSPEDRLTLSPASRVEFIKIMPVVGG